jgi:penicillin-insensitive murein endopeptidase
MSVGLRRACLVGLAVTSLVGGFACWAHGLLDGGPSRSFGTPAHGHLEGGVLLPAAGKGFITYSAVGHALGRQYVHSLVRDALLAAFAARADAEPGRVFVIGETGWRRGGRFRPHCTHQNGLSVDVFMPVDKDGSPAVLDTGADKRLGYGLELDAKGRIGDLRIDFESLAAFLRELDVQGRRRSLTIAKIIVAPEYVPLLLATPSGMHLGALEHTLLRTPAWVRHDEHFHIDFALAAR